MTAGRLAVLAYVVTPGLLILVGTDSTVFAGLLLALPLSQVALSAVGYVILLNEADLDGYSLLIPLALATSSAAALQVLALCGIRALVRRRKRPSSG